MENLQKDFVTYNQAFRLKALGFNEPCFGGYDMETLKLWIGYLNDGEQFNREYYYPAPTFSAAFRWFREKYNYDIVVSGFYNSGKKYFYRIETAPTIGLQSFGGDYRTYDEAELACLDKLIEIVESKEK